MKVLLTLIVLLVLPFSTSFSADSKGKFLVGMGGSFPIETFSEQVDVGYGLQLGYERHISDHVSLIGKWGYTNNSLKAVDEATTVNSGEAAFKYYFTPIALKKTSVSPYMLFSSGVVVVNDGLESVDVMTVVGSTFGFGALWVVNPGLNFFAESVLGMVDGTKRISLSGGIALPFDAF